MFNIEDDIHRLGEFYKRNKNSVIWWASDLDFFGRHYFTFDQKTIFNLHEDYPQKLSREQREIFDRDFPRLAEMFEE